MRGFKKIISPALMLALLAGVLAPAHIARAAVSFGAIGTSIVGTNSLSVPLPASIAAGNLLVLSIANKHPTDAPSTPSGWQALNDGQWFGGLGSAAADSGTVYSSVFVRVADGTESGDVSVAITSGNCAVGVITRYEKGPGTYWDVAATKGTDNIAGPTHDAWSVTGAANPGITAGDMIITTSAINSDLAAWGSFDISATSISAWGTDTERTLDNGTTGTSNGNDCELVVATHPVTTGTASAAPTFTMTSSGTETSVAPTGATVFLRIREVTNPSTDTTITSPVSVTGGISVLGALAKGAGTFVIDHPLDPKNMLLYHSFVESPEVKNIYDGIVMLNTKGEATIALPPYFLALGRDYRYLATPIGEPMPNLHLTKEVRKQFFGLFGQPVFKIGGGEPHGRVSWQVSAVRKDPFILENPIIPEVPKGPEEIADVGEYICPECYE